MSLGCTYIRFERLLFRFDIPIFMLLKVSSSPDTTEALIDILGFDFANGSSCLFIPLKQKLVLSACRQR